MQIIHYTHVKHGLPRRAYTMNFKHHKQFLIIFGKIDKMINLIMEMCAKNNKYYVYLNSLNSSGLDEWYLGDQWPGQFGSL